MAHLDKHHNGPAVNTTGFEKTIDDGNLEPAGLGEHARGRQFSLDAHDVAMVQTDQNVPHRNLRGRHMQMIAM